METGSSREAVLASHSVVIANGSGGAPTWRATVMATGVSRTAVVSRLSSDGARHGEHDDEQPQHDDPAPRGAGGAVRRDVEEARQVADLGDEGDRDEEDEDRRDALDELGEVEVHVTASASWPAATAVPARGGAVSSTSKRSESRSARAWGVRGASAWTSSRVTRPRVCLAMCEAPGTVTCTQRSARSPVGRHTAAYVLDRQSTTSSRGLTTASSAAGSSLRHSCDEVADAGEGAADVDPVGGHAVAEAQRTEEGRDDDDPAVGAALGGRVERVDVEGLVEHAGVDVGRPWPSARSAGGCCARCRRRGWG